MGKRILALACLLMLPLIIALSGCKTIQKMRDWLATDANALAMANLTVEAAAQEAVDRGLRLLKANKTECQSLAVAIQITQDLVANNEITTAEELVTQFPQKYQRFVRQGIHILGIYASGKPDDPVYKALLQAFLYGAEAAVQERLYALGGPTTMPNFYRKHAPFPEVAL